MRTLRTWIGTVASLSSYGYVLLGLCAFGGEHYTVQGRLRFEILSKHAVDDYTFTVAVSNHLWGIEVRPVKKSDVSRVLQVYDGKHVTCATYPSKREATEGFLTVEESEIPSLEAAGYSEQLWLAYASRYYFDQVKGDRLKPITYQPIERRSSGFTTPAKWERSDEGVGLPQSVLYYYDLHLSLKQSNTNAQRSTSEGIVWAAYNASEFTNVSGVSVPLAFSFTAYEALKEVSQPGSRFPVFRVEGWAESVQSDVSGNLLDPTFHGVGVVDDFRVSEGRNEWRLTYRITNSAPPSVSSPLIAFLKSRKVSLFKVSKAPIGWTRAKSRLLFTAMALFVSAVFVRVIINKTTTQKG